MTLEEVELLREGWDFEAKLAAGRDGQGEVPVSMWWETYSAMANTAGGTILLGAKERKDGSLDVRGIANVDKVEKDLWSLLGNRKKVSVNLLREQDVERIRVGDATALLLRVPKAGRQDLPVYINNSWEDGTYVRVHDGDRRLGREHARRLVADSVRDRDSGILDDFTLEDLNRESVARYRNYFRAARPDHPFVGVDDEEFLVCIGAAGRERGGSGPVRPTWAGLYMLGEEISIRELLPYWHLSFKELPDDPEDPRRWLDRVYPDGMWNANVFEFYLRAIVKLHDGLKVPFELEHGQFRKAETPVHQAVREALVNTLVHADYQGTTGIRVIKQRSGFEFINPGLLLVSAEQLWQGGVSEPRNPALHRMFGLLQLVEREGSGGPAMRSVWRSQSWRSPHVVENMEHLETRLRMPLESLLPEDAVDRLVRRFGTKFTTLDELGRNILVTTEVEGSTNHARIRELCDEHSRDITLKFQELIRHGFLESSGNSRGVRYRSTQSGESPTQNDGTSSDTGGTSSDANGTSSDANGTSSDASGTSSDASGTSSTESDASSTESDASSTESDASSTQTAASSTQTAASSTQTAASSTQTTPSSTQTTPSPTQTTPSLTQTTPNPTQTTPNPTQTAASSAQTEPARSAVSLVASSRSAANSLIRLAIVEICTSDYRTINDIANILNRKPKTIRQNYVPKMVGEGLLKPRFANPSHPGQAYRARTADEDTE